MVLSGRESGVENGAAGGGARRDHRRGRCVCRRRCGGPEVADACRSRVSRLRGARRVPQSSLSPSPFCGGGVCPSVAKVPMMAPSLCHLVGLTGAEPDD